MSETTGEVPKRHGKIVGYTTGVFDLFHIGHLKIIQRAKENCDFLIVGVSTDKLVQEYKGKTPIIPFKERSLIVEALKYVDMVVPQQNRDKLSAFHRYQFDKMFVGDDWKKSKFFSNLEREFKELGVEIVYFPYTSGTSSTQLTNTLRLIANQNR